MIAAPDRIAEKVLLDVAYRVADRTPCWHWRGDWPGYAVMRIGGHCHRAHRAVYELLVGPIPPGLQIDHLCRNPRCVNPDHLEPVTRGENRRRGLAGNANGWCRNGHDLAVHGAFRAYRQNVVCLACQRLTKRRYRARGGIV